MPHLFFQSFWHIIGKDVVEAIQSFSYSGKMLKAINETIISLIPKVDFPINLAQFRPIALCNTLYKIISKFLVNRLKPFLNLCISENQSAFLPGRQILDNVTIAHECMHFLKNKNKGKTSFLALKLDMAKAYNRIEWSFLATIMNKMGFNSIWIYWIMTCVSSVSFSFILNGSKVGYVKPNRGIRQRDPLSPIFCAEGFSSLLNHAGREKQITGLKIYREGPNISYMFYVDDSIIFCKASSQEVRKVMQIIHKYKAATGQLVNLEKSSVFIRINTSPEIKRDICSNLRNVHCVTQGTYLGLPMVITKSKNQIFGVVRDRIKSKILD
ncbi:hypothetical protein ACH5RR_022100 [Cinchona calisaya]|uniref:Reverse transcriptase domain-containing protein n=1 Tax=Cinchona calisaya TaxID=153742 RepID=A0ABD2Z7X3_9GENT